MGDVWARSTTIVDAGDLPADVATAIERRTFQLGLDWAPRPEHLAWATDSTTEVGRLRRRTRVVRTVGVVGDTSWPGR